jgi:hypothetical protein
MSTAYWSRDRVQISLLATVSTIQHGTSNDGQYKTGKQQAVSVGEPVRWPANYRLGTWQEHNLCAKCCLQVALTTCHGDPLAATRSFLQATVQLVSKCSFFVQFRPKREHKWKTGVPFVNIFDLSIFPSCVPITEYQIQTKNRHSNM